MFFLPTSGRARYACMGLFFTVGMLYASWGVHIPTLKSKFDLSDAMLSFAMFVVAAGSIAVLTQIGPWIARVGNRTACTTGGLLMCSSAALILYVPWFSLLLPLLALFGVGMALIDVAMNAEASTVETALGQPIMSSLHGMFSVGGIVGAAGGGFLLSHGMAPPVHFVLTAAVSSALVVIMRPALLATPVPSCVPVPLLARGQLPAIRRGLWALGTLALVALIAEGAMYDWLTVYMQEILKTNQGISSAAYAVFSAGMAISRFSGDAIRTRIGDERLLLASGVLASIAMLISLLLPHPNAVLISFGIAGLGFANMMPVLTLAAARVKGVPAVEGIARVAGMAYVGLLIGPVLIGAVANITNLPIGLSLVAVCAALVAICGPRVLRAEQLHNE